MPDTFARLHRELTGELSDWSPREESQAALRDEYLDHLAAHPDGLWREGPPGHITFSTLVVSQSGTHVLLTHHRKAGLWLQFGGHAEESDETIREAAEREVREESGLDLRVGEIVELNRHDLVGAFGRCRTHWDVRFLAVAPDRAVPTTSEESHDVGWWPADALPADSPTDLRTFIERSRRARG